MFNFSPKRKARRTLEKYVSPEAAEAIVSNRQPAEIVMRPGRVEFIFALLKNSEISVLTERVPVVMSLSNQHGATIHDICGPLVVLAFGTFKADHPNDARFLLVDQLHRTLRKEVKIVHGAAEGHFGVLGAESRYSYTFTFPRFAEALAALSQLNDGEITEFI